MRHYSILSTLLLFAACGTTEEEPADLGSTADVVEDSSPLDVNTAGDAGSDAETDPGPDGEPDLSGDAIAEEDTGCEPSCGDRECGADGCGGVCGPCSETEVCEDGYCAPECVPSCESIECGDDGCDGTCGSCPSDFDCVSGLCECMPSCDGAVCGDDGCSDNCGPCPDDEFCASGACVAECLSDCSATECGDDGCGSECGPCTEGEVCAEGVCECAPDCVGRGCGDNGCEGLCGECGAGLVCVDGGCLCEPSCVGIECGGNGCGGTCGECATECVDGSCAPEAGCPPDGPFGVTVGDVLRDYTLQTCDGETVSIHELCGNPASLIIGYAGWCPPCNSNAPLWQAGYASRADSGLGVYFVINQNTSAAVPDATYCAGTRDRFGLTMPVLFDPTGRFHSTLGMAANDSSIVIDSDFEVIATGQYRSTSSVFADVDALLAP